MTPELLTTFIRNQAMELGFSACGFAPVKALPETVVKDFKSWLQDERHGSMRYMEQHFEKRMNPGMLVEGSRSVVVVALNYFPDKQPKADNPKIARFAYGQDYHGFIRGKLNLLLENLRKEGVPVKGRAFSDSAPILERYWAVEAGLGWIGKNRLLIVPGMGSYLLLGVLLLDLELEYDTPMSGRCGNCTRCLQGCPTQALDNRGLDAKKCLSYLTIEKKGDFSPDEQERVSQNDWIFGCDRCQEVCPWNRFAVPHSIPELKPSEAFLKLDVHTYKELSPAGFADVFGGTCLERTGFVGLQRNIKFVTLDVSTFSIPR